MESKFGWLLSGPIYTLAPSAERNNTISPKSKGQLGSTGPYGEHVYE